MKAEERARLAIAACTVTEGPDFDVLLRILTEHIREAEQQARKEALEHAAIRIRDYLTTVGRGDVSDNVYHMIRALIEREDKK